MYLPLQTINIGHSYTFEERYYEQWKIAAEAIKQHEDVAASSMSKGHRDHTAHQTNNT